VPVRLVERGGDGLAEPLLAGAAERAGVRVLELGELGAVHGPALGQHGDAPSVASPTLPRLRDEV
jgi:hypothetical protein